ncbi:MAG: ArsR/SmtB family transcription factor [Actinomycetota bacterium]|nr:metalloregulator ArsR/SmtB family transcription factor [Actinomycetota bacterium]
MKTATKPKLIQELVPAACCAPLAKPSITDDEAGMTAKLFKALSDPHRVRIVNLLANAPEPLCVCDITEVVDLKQPTVSFHLKKLVASGLIHREQRGVWGYYSLSRNALRRLARTFEPKGASK